MKTKLTSRKFWALVTAVIVSVLVAFNADNDTTQSVTGIIAAVGACIAYIFAEAKVDAAKKDRPEDK